MTTLTTELDAYLEFLKQLDSDFHRGESVSEVCGKYGLSSVQFSTLMDRFAIPQNSPESLTRSEMTKIVIPIFTSRKGKDEVRQTASGVLLRVSSQSFLLTAAHVTDELNHGYLLVPGEQNIIGADGYASHWKPSVGETRTEDKIDIAYIRLNKRARSRIHSSFRDVTLDEISYANSVASIPFATFVGYPVTKAGRRSGTHSSEIVTYTGHQWTKDVYDRMGFSQENHMCVRMRLKQTYSSLHQRKLMAPHTEGISGGAILSWPSTLKDRANTLALRLMAIAHSFIRNENCLVGTHIKMFIQAILHHHPKLRPTVQRAIDKAK